MPAEPGRASGQGKNFRFRFRSGPAGFTVLEALFALSLLGLVLHGGWSVFATFRRAAESAEVSAQGLETVRTVGWILSQELSGGVPGTDWWAGEGDSLGLRAFRGLALARHRTPGGEVVVCYRGVRNPNPEKDSVLVLGSDGNWRARGLAGRSSGAEGCWDGVEGREEIWTVEEPEPQEEWYLARVFERGSYHLADGALRYRSGAGGGRQPLTAPNLREGRFRISPGEVPGLDWHLTLEAGRRGAGMAWRGRVR